MRLLRDRGSIHGLLDLFAESGKEVSVGVKMPFGFSVNLKGTISKMIPGWIDERNGREIVGYDVYQKDSNHDVYFSFNLEQVQGVSVDGIITLWDVVNPSGHILPHQFYRMMSDIYHKHGVDTEGVHVEMDKAMCKTLRSLGYDNGVDIFENTTKWYK